MSKRRGGGFYQDSPDPLFEDHSQPDNGGDLSESDAWEPVRSDDVLPENERGEEALSSDWQELISVEIPESELEVVEEIISSNEEIYVKIIREVAKGQMLVFDKSGDGYITSNENLAQTSAWQPVSIRLLEHPYQFEEELDSRMPTKERYRQHLWRQGIVLKEDLDDPKNRKILDNLLPKLS